MRKVNPGYSKDTAGRRTKMIDELLDEGFTPEQIMVMAQSREQDKQKKKEKEADIERLENEIKAKFEEYINAAGAGDIKVDDLKLDDLFNIIKGEFKIPFDALTREEKMGYQAIAEELRKELKKIGVEI
jgi:DNA-binding transcriptional MerR regulator